MGWLDFILNFIGMHKWIRHKYMKIDYSCELVDSFRNLEGKFV